MLRKGAFEYQFPLTPRQIGRNQRIDISVNGKVPGRVDAGDDPEDNRGSNRQPRMTRAAGDDGENGMNPTQVRTGIASHIILATGAWQNVESQEKR